MNIDLIFAIIFYGLLILFGIIHRKRFTVVGKIFFMYKTKLGIRLMDSIAKKIPRTLKVIGIFGIGLGFVGMIVVFFWLIKGLYDLITIPEAPATLGLVLPGVKIPGAPVFVPFWYGIISIFVVAAIHEFFHGVYSRVYNVEVKSSGFAFLGPILAAFVEPDEKELPKKSKTAQLSIFAAGPFSNLLTAGVLVLILLFVMTPVAYSLLDIKGAKIIDVEKSYPLADAGATKNEIIEEVNGIKINNVNDFTNVVNKTRPNEVITVKTNKTLYNIVTVAHPKIKDRGYLGVIVGPASVNIKESIVNKYSKVLPTIFLWFAELLKWIFALSLGIGIVNLLPLGPVDGGRMFYTAISSWTKNEDRSKRIWIFISYLSLVLVILNIAFPYLRKLF